MFPYRHQECCLCEAAREAEAVDFATTSPVASQDLTASPFVHVKVKTHSTTHAAQKTKSERRTGIACRPSGPSSASLEHCQSSRMVLAPSQSTSRSRWSHAADRPSWSWWCCVRSCYRWYRAHSINGLRWRLCAHGRHTSLQLVGEVAPMECGAGATAMQLRDRGSCRWEAVRRVLRMVY